MSTSASDEAFPQAQRWVLQHEVDLRLHQLGASSPPFVDAGQEGHLQRRIWNTPDDFGAAAGFTSYGASLRGLRRSLRELHGFHNGRFIKIPVTYNEEESVAFAICWADDDRIGKDGDDPSTNVKGPATVAAVVESGPQGTLDLDRPVDLWYLLLCATGEGELWGEVSWAAYTDASRRISGWHERIILGRVDPGAGDEVAIPDTDAPSATSDITIDISRKSA